MNNLRAIRERIGLTQAEVAEALGCTQGNIGHYELRGQTFPPDAARKFIDLAARKGHVVTFDDIYEPAPARRTTERRAKRAA